MAEKTKIIAVVTELDWPLRRHYELVTGVRQYAKEHETWKLEISRFPKVQIEAGMQFDGFVGRIGKDAWETARKAGIPVVNTMMGSKICDRVHNVVMDYEASVLMSAKHLYGRGMRNLLHVWLQDQDNEDTTLSIIKKVAQQLNVPYHTCMLPPEVEFNADQWKETRNRLQEAVKDLSAPVGVSCSTDSVAGIVINTMTTLGWKIPYDMAVLGHGNEEVICTTIEPSISSIDVGHVRIGYEAAKTLARLIRGEEIPDTFVEIPPKKLVLRSSSEAFNVGDSEVQKALRYMMVNYQCKIGVPEITAQTGIGRKSLEKRFQDVMQTSIYKELTRLRTEEAKRLLVDDILYPIKDLFEHCGFSTTSNFYVAFKKHTGMSPAKYRKEHADPKQW